MNTNRKSTTVDRLERLLNRRSNLSTEYIRYLGKLAATGEPSAAPVIAAFLDMPGVVGDCAVRSLLRLAWSSSDCLQTVLRTCEDRVERSLDSDEIRNSGRVCKALVRRIPLRNAA